MNAREHIAELEEENARLKRGMEAQAEAITSLVLRLRRTRATLAELKAAKTKRRRTKR